MSRITETRQKKNRTQKWKIAEHKDSESSHDEEYTERQNIAIQQQMQGKGEYIHTGGRETIKHRCRQSGNQGRWTLNGCGNSRERT